MDSIILISIYFFELVKIYLVNILLYDKAESIKQKKIHFIITSIMMIGIGMITVNTLPVYLMGQVGGWFLTEGKHLEKLRKYISIVSVILCMDAGIEIIIKKIWESNRGSDLIVSLLSSAVFCFFLFIKKHFPIPKHNIKIPMQSIIAALCISFSFGVAVIEDWFSYLPDKVGRLNYDLVLVFTFVTVLLLVFLTVYVEKTNNELEKTAEIEKELRLLQKKNYTLLLEKEEETKKYRHDMSNHITCLYQLAQKEDAEQTMLYLEKMRHNLRTISKMSYETGIEILDILLNTMLADLSDVEISIKGKCSGNIAINEVEGCTVFSNLLQNALDELQRQTMGPKKLTVQVNGGKLYSSIIVKNTISETSQIDLRRLETKKIDKENHGYGINNIKNILEKTGGKLELKIEESQFIAEVILRNYVDE